MSAMADCVEATVKLRPFHRPACEIKRTEFIDGHWVFKEWKDHVCGLSGYGLHPDDYCAGCREQPTLREPQCTCGLFEAVLLAVEAAQ